MIGRLAASLLFSAASLLGAGCGTPSRPTGMAIEFTVISEGFNVENLQGSTFLRNVHGIRHRAGQSPTRTG